jgi:hypothetical protein
MMGQRASAPQGPIEAFFKAASCLALAADELPLSLRQLGEKRKQAESRLAQLCEDYEKLSAEAKTARFGPLASELRSRYMDALNSVLRLAAADVCARVEVQTAGPSMAGALLTIRDALERAERGEPPADSYLVASQAYRSIVAKSRRIRGMLAGADPLPEHEFLCLQMHLVQRRAIQLFLRYLRYAAARERS